MDLNELMVRSRIDLRRLRYCLDNCLYPEGEVVIENNGAGRVRRFGPDVALGVVCGARLLEIGMPRARARALIATLASLCAEAPGGALLAAVARDRIEATATFGDGIHVRLRVPALGFDSGWRAVFFKTAEGYEPRLELTIHLGRLARDLFVPAGTKS